ncbi:Ribosome biogenesis GTP-binding protein YlqF [Thermobacillus xylanilyticus]|jgi:ribosome biogenesis GTPase A|uniref:Ribosome biogenesis GTPase A n=1 Tax=Thermobacillus xylanilyticus TaxID=76633 RepID=A0ABN7RTU1_THEXY|nr:ribosome biogenesis GTPase YlqF [Thermobacillus xylanilyticus]CAG5083448.1 Ribosome biogenesis GTP-binding protein YlqF [Thermobacillus xylanilyticus]
MTIQWFPGHMTRARRQIQEKLKQIDAVIELLDARVPHSSRNPMIDEILRGKPRLVLLNKADLADQRATDRWIAAFREDGLDSLAVDAAGGQGIKEISARVKKLVAPQWERMAARGVVKPRAVRVLIVGIPNVGKSTLINRLAGRSVAATGDRPGVTKGQQWIKVGGEMELLDTPGILWPKFDDQTVGMRLAVIGSIREEILNLEEIAFFAVKTLAGKYWDAFVERFGLEGGPPEDPDDPGQIVDVLERIGRKRGCLVSGGRVDLEKASGVLLRDLRSGKLGRITLEEPEEFR